MIRQNAFLNTGNSMLKGGLHCHTTRSDGKVAPDEVLKIHQEHGYDFLAITDHRKYNFTNYAPETGILIIPGMEMDYGLPVTAGGIHCFHEVCIGPVEGNGYTQDQTFVSSKVQNQDELQPYLDDIHAHNNLTIYAHPGWSSTAPEEFDRLKGNFAMEVWNSTCARDHDLDTDALYWDILLRKGVKIFGVATDDGHKKSSHCNGWVRVNAQKDVASILDALKNGAFYSSTGPEIYDFTVDGSLATIRCSEVEKIRFHYGYRPTAIVHPEEEGTPLTKGYYMIPEGNTYIRASVVDKEGHIAWTNPIFLKEND